MLRKWNHNKFHFISFENPFTKLLHFALNIEHAFHSHSPQSRLHLYLEVCVFLCCWLAAAVHSSHSILIFQICLKVSLSLSSTSDVQHSIGAEEEAEEKKEIFSPFLSSNSTMEIFAEWSLIAADESSSHALSSVFNSNFMMKKRVMGSNLARLSLDVGDLIAKSHNSQQNLPVFGRLFALPLTRLCIQYGECCVCIFSEESHPQSQTMNF